MATKDICNIGNYYDLDNISVYIYMALQEILCF